MKIIIFFTLFLMIYSRPLTIRKVRWAVNAGSGLSKRASKGIIFDADKDFDASESVQVGYPDDQIIKYTDDPEIYRTERQADSSFSYNIPIQGEESYVIILKFCERHFDAGERVFDINLGDNLVAKVDVAGKVGKFSVLDEYIEIQYTKGEIYQGRNHLPGCIVDGKLRITFVNVAGGGPFVNGLMLYQGTIYDTDYHDIYMFKELWEKKHREEERKKYLEK